MRKLVGLEQRLHAAGNNDGLAEEMEQLQRRLKRALEEVQELKRRNAELEQHATARRSQALRNHRRPAGLGGLKNASSWPTWKPRIRRMRRDAKSI